MTPAPRHPAEAARLSRVRATLERAPGDHEALRTLTDMAARLLRVPIAMVNLVDETRAVAVAASGTRLGARDRGEVMCSWAVSTDAPLHVVDLAADPRFRDGVVVRGGLRSYHGVPVRSADGLPLGALCVLDERPHDLDEEERQLLRELALLAGSHLALLTGRGTTAVAGGAPAPASRDESAVVPTVVAAATLPPAEALQALADRGAPQGGAAALLRGLAAPAPAGQGPDAVLPAPELDVADGLAAGQFLPYYQPIVDLADGRTVGVEALARWEQPDGTLLSPAAFLPVAEQDHLVLALDALMLEEACTQVEHWRRTRPDAAGLELSVNVSGAHLRGGALRELVEGALTGSGLPAHALTLELTETTLIASGDDTTVEQLQGLRDLGVGLALDDFGTAYSTLTYLRRFPVTRLKVDRSFVRGLGVDRRDALLVESVVGLARGLGLDVVGEGVETPRQAAMLRSLGCDKGQGYHFQRPTSAERLETTGCLGPLAVRRDDVPVISFGTDEPDGLDVADEASLAGPDGAAAGGDRPDPWGVVRHVPSQGRAASG